MMEPNKKIIFTESAQIRLEKLHKDINQEIEEYLRERRNVPGDDIIEITASDIDDLSYRLKIIRPLAKNAGMKQIVLIIYIITGLVMTIGGLFYDDLRRLFIMDQSRLVVVLSGIMISLTAIILALMLKLKEKRQQELFDYEREKKKIDEFYLKYKAK